MFYPVTFTSTNGFTILFASIAPMFLSACWNPTQIWNAPIDANAFISLPFAELSGLDSFYGLENIEVTFFISWNIVPTEINERPATIE